jgi:hypothetical protein
MVTIKKEVKSIIDITLNDYELGLITVALTDYKMRLPGWTNRYDYIQDIITKLNQLKG